MEASDTKCEQTSHVERFSSAGRWRCGDGRTWNIVWPNEIGPFNVMASAMVKFYWQFRPINCSARCHLFQVFALHLSNVGDVADLDHKEMRPPSIFKLKGHLQLISPQNWGSGVSGRHAVRCRSSEKSENFLQNINNRWTVLNLLEIIQVIELN